MNAKISMLIFYIGLIVLYLILFVFEDFFYKSFYGLPILYLGLFLFIIGASLMAMKLVHYERILKRNSKKTKSKVSLSDYIKKNYLSD
jgi:predicted tellurium resistance membrane protein TerC